MEYITCLISAYCLIVMCTPRVEEKNRAEHKQCGSAGVGSRPSQAQTAMLRRLGRAARKLIPLSAKHDVKNGQPHSPSSE